MRAPIQSEPSFRSHSLEALHLLTPRAAHSIPTTPDLVGASAVRRMTNFDWCLPRLEEDPPSEEIRCWPSSNHLCVHSNFLNLMPIVADFLDDLLNYDIDRTEIIVGKLNLTPIL